MMSTATDLTHRRLIAAGGAGLTAVVLTWHLDDDRLDRAIAALIALAATATLLASKRSGRGAKGSPWKRSGLGLATLLLAAAIVFALVAPVSAAWSVRTAHETTPQATVREFLSAAVVDHSGFAASRYLAPRARLSFERHSPTLPDVDTFFGSARLTLGGLRVQSNRQINALSLHVVRDGSARLVEVSHGGHSVLFVLRPTSPADRSEFHAPPTPWRIDSSVAELGPARRLTNDAHNVAWATSAPSPGLVGDSA